VKVPACTGVTFQTISRVWWDASEPKLKVSVCAAWAPAEAVWPASFGKPSSRIQTGRKGMARPCCSERTENEP
jgi:hypothetical protein